jgi:hypothetical protein
LENGVASLARDPAIREQIQRFEPYGFVALNDFVDARVKPGHDAACAAAFPLADDEREEIIPPVARPALASV